MISGTGFIFVKFVSVLSQRVAQFVEAIGSVFVRRLSCREFSQGYTHTLLAFGPNHTFTYPSNSSLGQTTIAQKRGERWTPSQRLFASRRCKWPYWASWFRLHCIPPTPSFQIVIAPRKSASKSPEDDFRRRTPRSVSPSQCI